MVSQSSSVGYTITGKTADLTVVQKTTIDTLHKEGKTQKVIAKEAGCSQSSVSKHINREAKGRKRCGRKKCTSNRDNRTLERIVKQNPFKNVGEIHKEWTAAGVSASRTTTHRRMQDMGFSCRIPCVKPFLNNRQRQKRLASKRTGLLLIGPKLCSLMKVNFAFPLDIRVPESGGREERHTVHVA
uniref:Transposase Tc1-like domain-containing protein n=1 Tax=Cyprinus carpio carpio TaxID=630221 RepID=A0A9J8ABC9_CYPCA